MQNPAIALLLNFNVADLKGESFQKRWTVFRDSELCKFLVIFMDKRIAELQSMLERCNPDRTLYLQGQVFEARKIKEFLGQAAISNEIETVSAYLGYPTKK